MINKELEILIREEEELSVAILAKKFNITEEYIIKFAFENYQNQLRENREILKKKTSYRKCRSFLWEGNF